jgi:hypothetical protein
MSDGPESPRLASQETPMTASLVLTSAVAFLLGETLADEKRLSEKQKIEALVKHVEEMKDASFVRNGTKYDAKTAATFLRRKWKSNESAIKTARDFIEKVASVSSTSGKPYMIRRKNGKETKSGDYLLAELKKIEAPADKKPAK